MSQVTAIRTKGLAVPVLGAIALVVALVVLWPRQPEYPPVVQAGIRLMGCMERGDADCMYEFIPDEDRNTYGLTREEWKWFIEDYGRDIPWSKSVPGGKVEAYGNENYGIVRVSRPSIDGFGKRGAQSAAIARTDKGYQSPVLATSLIIGIPPARGRTRDYGEGEWRGAKLEAFIRDAELLESHGIKGYPIEGQFLTWAEHIARLQGMPDSGGSGSGQQ